MDTMTARWLRAGTALLISLAMLAGCKVDSINPITPAESAQADTALHGVWRYREKDELTFVHIGPEFSLDAQSAEAKRRRTRIVIVDHKKNGLTDEAYVAHASRVGARRYLNVVQFDDGKPAGFIFVRYKLLDRDTLSMSTIDEAALKSAIGAGRIKGTMRGAGLSSETAISAETPEIESFLRAEGDRIFGPSHVLKRIR